MTKKIDLERVGGGSFGIYRPKPKKSGFWDVVGGIALVFVVLVIIGAIFG